MNRRHFLGSVGALSASNLFPKARCEGAHAELSQGWRTFQVETRVEILRPSGITRIWLPTALLSKTPFQTTLSNEFTAPGGTARVVETMPMRSGSLPRSFQPT